MVIEFWSGWSELLYLTPSESSEEEYFELTLIMKSSC